MNRGQLLRRAVSLAAVLAVPEPILKALAPAAAPAAPTGAMRVTAVGSTVRVPNGSYFRLGDIIRDIHSGETMAVIGIEGNNLKIRHGLDRAAA